MAPFKALYGRNYRTPLNLFEPGERRYYGIDFVKEGEERVQIIQQHIEASKVCQCCVSCDGSFVVPPPQGLYMF